MTRTVLRWLWVAIVHLAAGLFVLGLLVRFTVRDNYNGIAAVFYATPWAVLTVLAFVCLIHWRCWQRTRRVAALATLSCLLMWILTSFRFGPREASTTGAFRIAYWNVARPESRLDGVLQEASAWKADLFVFGEHRPKGPTPAAWQRHFTPNSVLPLSRELLLVSSQIARRDGREVLDRNGACEVCRVTIQGREVVLLIVDFFSNYSESRRSGFKRLFQIVDAYAEKPLIVLGDFNTPADSAHFKELRARLNSAFATAGHGYAATWPMPLPVLELDHIWTNRHLRVVRCEHITSFYSDHRAVVADVVFP